MAVLDLPEEPATDRMTDPAAGPATSGAGPRRGVGPQLRIVSATTAVGLGLGLLVGGVGGRLAMRALFLTSGPSVRGMISDDGFPIGRFDLAATLNLLLVGTFLGVIGAFVYLAVRPSLLGPTWLRRTGCAIGAGAVVGTILVSADGVDFTELGPRWFAIALFVALPALFGVLAATAVDRAIRPGGWFMTGPARLTSLPLLAFAFPPLLVVLGVPILGVLGVRRLADAVPAVGRVVRHPVSAWALRLLWFGVGSFALWTLIVESVELLTTA